MDISANKPNGEFLPSRELTEHFLRTIRNVRPKDKARAVVDDLEGSYLGLTEYGLRQYVGRHVTRPIARLCHATSYTQRHEITIGENGKFSTEVTELIKDRIPKISRRSRETLFELLYREFYDFLMSQGPLTKSYGTFVADSDGIRVSNIPQKQG